MSQLRGRQLVQQKKAAAFLEALAASGSVSEACRKSKLPRPTAYFLRKEDKAFAKAWDEALELGLDTLEDAAVERAKAGSDTLAIFLLKCRRPDKYRDRQELHHTGSVQLTGVRQRLVDRLLARIDAKREQARDHAPDQD